MDQVVLAVSEAPQVRVADCIAITITVTIWAGFMV